MLVNIDITRMAVILATYLDSQFLQNFHILHNVKHNELVVAVTLPGTPMVKAVTHPDTL